MEKRRERNMNQFPCRHAPTRERTCKPGMCPDQETNRRTFALLDNDQPTELQWPRHFLSQFLTQIQIKLD